MARLLAPLQLLRRLCETLHRRAVEAGLALPVELGLAVDDKKYHILVTRSRAKAVSRRPAEHSVRLGPADFTRLLLGQVDWDRGLAEGRLQAATARRLAITAGMTKWYVDGKEYDMKSFPIVVKRGSREVWEISNAEASMPHPMHIHGFHYRVLERRGTPDQAALVAGDEGLLPTDLAAKDTILVWPGETVSVEIDFSHSFSGSQDYVFHCHNLEHESAGMMLNFRVEG